MTVEQVFRVSQALKSIGWNSMFNVQFLELEVGSRKSLSLLPTNAYTDE